MSPTTPVTIRVPNETLARMRLAASQRGVTLTELMLSPWTAKRDPGPPPDLGSGGKKAPIRTEAALTDQKRKPFKSRLKGEWKAP